MAAQRASRKTMTMRPSPSSGRRGARGAHPASTDLLRPAPLASRITQNPGAKSPRSPICWNQRDNDGQKTLVFSQFTSFLSLIADKLDKLGIPYYTITGATPKKQRIADLVSQFNPRRYAGILGIAQSGRNGAEPDGRIGRHPRRPLVERRNAKPGEGHRPRPPHRTETRRKRAQGYCARNDRRKNRDAPAVEKRLRRQDRPSRGVVTLAGLSREGLRKPPVNADETDSKHFDPR